MSDNKIRQEEITSRHYFERLHQLNVEIEALKSALLLAQQASEDTQDAERYRWLRNPDNFTREDLPCVSDDSFNMIFLEEFDAAIDKEIKEQAK